MADNTENKIVDRLKAEGDLIRNTGKNSLKSVRTDLAKFDVLFQSINENLIKQTQLLRASLKIQIIEARMKKSADELLKAERTTTDKKPEPAQIGPTTVQFSDEQRAGGFLTSLAGLFGIGSIGGAAGAISANLLTALRRPLRAALFTVIAPAVGTVIGAITEGALLGMGTDKENATKFGEAANLAGLWGMIGLAFGGRFGMLIGAGAGAASSFGDEILKFLDINSEKQISLFGKDFEAGFLASGGLAAIGGIAALLAPSILKLTGSLLLGVLTGPLGLAALTGAAVAGTALLVEQWMERRRNRFLTELEEETAKGFGNIDRITSGDDPGMLSRILMNLGITRAQTPGEELSEAASTIVSTARLHPDAITLGEFGMPEPPRVLTDTQAISAETSLKNILGIPEDESLASYDFSQLRGLSNLGSGNLNQLREVANILGITNLSERIDELLDIQRSIAETQTEIQRTRSYITSIESGAGARAMSSIPGAEELTNEEIEQIRRYNSQIADLIISRQDLERTLDGFSEGTRGFQDFGRGSFAVLHGREAVVPETTPAGQFLKNYFDENWQPILASKINQASESAITMAGNTSIVYAPTTVSPVTQVNRGGSSSVQMNTFGNNSRGDLDMMSIPGGVQ